MHFKKLLHPVGSYTYNCICHIKLDLSKVLLSGYEMNTFKMKYRKPLHVTNVKSRKNANVAHIKSSMFRNECRKIVFVCFLNVICPKDISII